MATDSKIAFNYLTKPFTFRQRARLKSFIIYLLSQEGRDVSQINYIFCDDAYLLQMNKNFLNHDTLTDIITFDLSNSPDEPVISDIYISIERVKANAFTYNVPFFIEFLRVVFHGALHLAGFKDKLAKDIEIIRSKEDAYIKQFLFHVEQRKN